LSESLKEKKAKNSKNVEKMLLYGKIVLYKILLQNDISDVAK